MPSPLSPEAQPVVKREAVHVEQESRRVVLLRLRKPQADQFNALSEAFAIAWPSAPNTAAGSGPRILWLAPDTWAIVGLSYAAVREQAAKALGARLHHLSDVSEGRVVFCIRGALARIVLNKGCSLDLHPDVLAPGHCAQSLLAQVPILIEPLVEGTPAAAAYRVYADISYAKFLRTWFADAVLEYP